MSEVSPEKWGRSPQRLLFLQGEIGQLPQNHYNAITLRPSLSGGYLCLSPAIGARNARVGCRPRRSFARPCAITFFRPSSTRYTCHAYRIVSWAG
jgi:hypothetical protein